MYRGDRLLDSERHVALFRETVTTPTAIIALQITLWFGLMTDHIVTCSDAVQAFLQSWLDTGDFTLVIMASELWQEAWKKRLPASAKVCVKLKKSLYGHPKAGRWWQGFLASCLVEVGVVEMEELPSNFIFRWNPSQRGGNFILVIKHIRGRSDAK